MTIEPWMSEKESQHLKFYLSRSHRYVEFGCGGSTCVATTLVSNWIISLDSSKEWIENVALECRKLGGIQPKMVHVDIGPLGDWGHPIDINSRDKWPNYSKKIWLYPEAHIGDIYLVDGRFRVACFLETLLHAKSNPPIMVHDFASCECYHIILEVAQEVDRVETLSTFIRKPNVNNDTIVKMLEKYRYEPD